MKNKENKLFLSTTEVATLLGVSRTAIFNKIKKGQIKTIRSGKHYLIPKEEIEEFVITGPLSENQKLEVRNALEKAVTDYGEALKKLSLE